MYIFKFITLLILSGGFLEVNVLPSKRSAGYVYILIVSEESVVPGGVLAALTTLTAVFTAANARPTYWMLYSNWTCGAIP